MAFDHLNGGVENQRIPDDVYGGELRR